jgi:DNA polymerase V
MSSCSESEPFALQVIGDSMEPEFRNGSVIIVDPACAIEDGAYVVAYHDDGVILRVLRTSDDSWYLVALNDDYPRIPISGPAQIRGRVIQRAGRRRNERKSYL